MTLLVHLPLEQNGSGKMIIHCICLKKVLHCLYLGGQIMQIDFKYRPDRQYHYEQYFQPQGLDFATIYGWCGRTFGLPGTRWDYHGGWVKLRSEQELMFFKLKWS
jgi:hypothetical protein